MNRINDVQKKTKEVDGCRLLSVDEISESLGLSKNTIYHWVHKRKIPYIKLGGLLKFRSLEVEEWINTKSIQSN